MNTIKTPKLRATALLRRCLWPLVRLCAQWCGVRIIDPEWHDSILNWGDVMYSNYREACGEIQKHIVHNKDARRLLKETAEALESDIEEERYQAHCKVRDWFEANNKISHAPLTHEKQN